MCGIVRQNLIRSEQLLQNKDLKLCRNLTLNKQKLPCTDKLTKTQVKTLFTTLQTLFK